MTGPAVVRSGPVRYAVAERFARPRPVRDGDRPPTGEICPQLPSRLDAVMGPPLDRHPQGEDCLNLTVTTPARDGAARPVMVWFHGGGFSSGAGLMDWYDGGALATEGDVVVVAVNYRVGALGYLCLDGVSEGNLGLYDQLEALRWVRRHIAAYGGDPADVTVFGQSAGALSIRLLMELPEARGCSAARSCRARRCRSPPGPAPTPRSSAGSSVSGSRYTPPAPTRVPPVRRPYSRRNGTPGLPTGNVPAPPWSRRSAPSARPSRPRTTGPRPGHHVRLERGRHDGLPRREERERRPGGADPADVHRTADRPRTTARPGRGPGARLPAGLAPGRIGVRRHPLRGTAAAPRLPGRLAGLPDAGGHHLGGGGRAGQGRARHLDRLCPHRPSRGRRAPADLPGDPPPRP